MKEFTFKSEAHTYWLGDRQLPSVTQIISPLVDYSKAHPGKLERKRNLGTAFHECIRLFLNNDLDEDSIDEELIIPMRQFREWWEDDEFKGLPSPSIIAIEKPFYNEKLKYAGTPDLVTEDCIYDFKLRKYNPIADPLQLAGYAGLISDFPPKRKVVVEFSLDSGYLPHDADKKQANSMFREMLKHYHRQQKRREEDQEFETLLEKWRKQ